MIPLEVRGVPVPVRRTVLHTYRVRYSPKPSSHHHGSADVLTVDVEGDLDAIPGLLPTGVYIMYIEDLTMGQNVHWTRWPKSYRPGFSA